ncbi:collagen alpha-1(XII) chain-like [Mytilus californianus]|uniref:collagen alpha-1(XII) chain-like n=1 Tax=Mytilus californianus TaxID=6549 RepID=UPI002246E4CB|nr:collagen alpha-1(XII) chain-like [Mytilus californianus]
MTFSSDNRLDIAFDSYTNKTELLQKIKNLKGTITNGITKTGMAINYTQSTILTTGNGARSGAEIAVIVMTDGQSSGYPKPEMEADNLRTDGAEVFSLGIGSALSASNAELKGIASNPDSYYLLYVSSFVYLCNLVPDLVPKLESSIAATLLSDCPEDPVVASMEQNYTSTHPEFSTADATTHPELLTIEADLTTTHPTLSPTEMVLNTTSLGLAPVEPNFGSSAVILDPTIAAFITTTLLCLIKTL